jgi:hypothetical protein
VAPLAKDLGIAEEISLLLIEKQLLATTPDMRLDTETAASPTINDICLGRGPHSSAFKHFFGAEPSLLIILEGTET